MKISQPELIQDGKTVKYQAAIQSALGVHTVWFSLDSRYADLINDSADSALVALLLPAMALGEDIEVNAPVSEKLYYTLASAYQGLLKSIHPSFAHPRLTKVAIAPADLVTLEPAPSGVMTGFSGGVDSFCTLVDHFYNDTVPDSFRITHLVYNNVGSHASGRETLFRQRFDRLKSLPEKLGLPFIAVNSNLQDIYEALDIGFTKSSIVRNVASALLFQGSIKRYLYSSGYEYAQLNLQQNITGAIDYWEPIAVPLLSTERMEFLSVGHEYQRLEKTLKLTEIEDSYRWLDVCAGSRSVGNCGRCKKCLQTQLTLEIAGKLEHYAPAFDLDQYWKIRDNFLPEPLLRNDPFRREIVEFAEAQGFQFPWQAHLLARTPYFMEIRDVARGIRDRLKGQKT